MPLKRTVILSVAKDLLLTFTDAEKYVSFLSPLS
jgi:hypothetical protein